MIAYSARKRNQTQIAALDLTNSQLPVLSLIHWDPTEASATRPLSIRKNETWYSYGQDLTKNVTELYKADGTIASTYDYTPYGAVTATGIEQPLQWSSEVYDTEFGMVYYNYRHYNPRDGRWINRDPIAEQGGWNLYGFVGNNMAEKNDYLGLLFKLVYDKNCKGKQTNVLEQFKIARDAISKGEKNLNPKLERYIRFFGKYSRARHKVVKRVITEIKRILDNATISINCCGDACKKNSLAYVYMTDGEFKVFLCPGFFNSPVGNGFKDQANTILHEVAHEVEMPSVHSISDRPAPWKPNTQPPDAPYGRDYVEWIAEHDAWTAVTNSENYAAYLSNNL